MLKIRRLRKAYNKGTENESIIFDGLNLDVEEGTVVALLGPNGCGKSTLMKLINGAEEADGGTVTLDDEPIEKVKEYQRAERIATVHQNPTAGVSPSLTIIENMSLADKKGERFGLRRLIRPSRKRQYQEMLSPLELNLENKLDVQAKYLSGGQRQALSLVLSTMKKPRLLLLDEHTAALDPKTSRLVMEKTMQIAREQKITTIMISHNLKDAIRYSDRLVMLQHGKIVMDCSPSEVSEEEILKKFNS